MKAQVTTPAGKRTVSLQEAKEMKMQYGYFYHIIVKCPYCGEDHPRGEFGAYCGLDCSVDHLRENDRKDYYNESGEEKDSLGIRR